MKKYILLIILITQNILAHPVSYTLDLTATYNETTKEALIICKSDSRNKCGLHNIYLNDENESIIAKAKYPFLKTKKIIKVDQKPKTMIFYLRNTPEHKYVIYF